MAGTETDDLRVRAVIGIARRADFGYERDLEVIAASRQWAPAR